MAVGQVERRMVLEIDSVAAAGGEVCPAGAQARAVAQAHSVAAHALDDEPRSVQPRVLAQAQPRPAVLRAGVAHQGGGPARQRHGRA